MFTPGRWFNITISYLVLSCVFNINGLKIPLFSSPTPTASGTQKLYYQILQSEIMWYYKSANIYVVYFFFFSR